MSQPSVPSGAKELYDRLALVYGNADERNGWALLWLCTALTAALQTLLDFASDTAEHPALGGLLDINTTPDRALAWIADQIVGVDPAGKTPQQLRTAIRELPNHRRGRPATMVAAAQQHLTGSKTVRLLERTGGNARQLTVITRTAETPNQAAVLRALLSQKRAGVVLTYIVSDDPIIEEGTLAINSAPNVAINTATLDDVT